MASTFQDDGETFELFGRSYSRQELEEYAAERHVWYSASHIDGNVMGPSLLTPLPSDYVIAARIVQETGTLVNPAELEELAAACATQRSFLENLAGLHSLQKVFPSRDSDDAIPVLQLYAAQQRHTKHRVVD